MLRPTSAEDADRVFAIQSDWTVTVMLRMASFPPVYRELSDWFADHRREWLAGEAHRFAVQLGGWMVGVVDIDNIHGDEGELGYWFERLAWGHGYASEAARAVVGFAFDEVGLSRLAAGHAVDNPASGRVLTRLGFRALDTVEVFSRSRGRTIGHRRYLLTAPR